LTEFVEIQSLSYDLRLKAEGTRVRFANRVTALLAILIVISSLIQFLAFDRIFFTTTNTLLSATSEKEAQNTGENLAAYFRRIQDILKTIASDPEVRQSQGALDKIKFLIPEINMIFILDRQGNILNATGTTRKSNLAKRDYFPRAMQGETYISNVFTSAADRRVIVIATPIIEDGQVSGVVAASIWLHDNYLAEMFDNKSFGRNGLTMITDAQGIIIYHIDKTRIGQRAAIFDSLQGTSGTVTMANDRGEEQYIGYYKVPVSNWLVAVHTPTAELKELRRLMIYQIVAVSLITIFLAVAIGVYTLRRNIKPFEKLVKAFSSIRKGKYRELAPSDYASEFDELVQAYNLTVKRLEDLHNALRGAADIDGLTRAYNRRAFEQAAAALNSELQTGSLKNFGILFLDLDNFKEINDKQGHMAGDDVLRDFVVLARSVVEPRALFRYGGDEFVIILRNLPLSTITALAEEIRLLSEQELRGCTASIGIATYPENANSIEELLILADKALYISKSLKNTVTVYTHL
jgi:diguanylate cyclase (GGDEF)-like protein